MLPTIAWQTLTDDELQTLLDGVLQERRRREATRPRREVGDRRASSSRQGAEPLSADEQRRRINAKGPFHCPCPRRFDDIDHYMEHMRLLHKDRR